MGFFKEIALEMECFSEEDRHLIGEYFKGNIPFVVLPLEIQAKILDLLTGVGI